ncbi:DddA-like double-stranded DNA deaminase toxin [Streptomyces sp. NPDC088341]|uniref:DddA-like double-stranded DNA deaminase toxin n=1 Tax=Streptomyces sp. NPDC088341 TaxID=3154870 RepID=UPI0034462F6C
MGQKRISRNQGAKYRASSHVETKYAVWMNENQVKEATVVINNNEGVCNQAQNCELAISHILP